MKTCPVCGQESPKPWVAAFYHFRLYEPGQWKWLKGNMSMFGRWSGFLSTCGLAFPVFNTLRFWRYRKSTLVLADGAPLASAFDANGCALKPAKPKGNES
jgi:hypothetical protein